MQLMKPHQLCNITYTKSADEVTERTIIPVSVPSKVVFSIDVSDLSKEDADKMLKLYLKYEQYRDRHMSMLFNFTEWADHTNPSIDTNTIKYRSFSVNKIAE